MLVNDTIVLHVRNHREIVTGVYDVKLYVQRGTHNVFIVKKCPQAIRENNCDRFVSRKKQCLTS